MALWVLMQIQFSIIEKCRGKITYFIFDYKLLKERDSEININIMDQIWIVKRFAPIHGQSDTHYKLSLAYLIWNQRRNPAPAAAGSDLDSRKFRWSSGGTDKLGGIVNFSNLLYIFLYKNKLHGQAFLSKKKTKSFSVCTTNTQQLLQN